MLAVGHGADATVREPHAYTTVLAKVQLLPLPAAEDAITGMREVDYGTYSSFQDAPFVFVTPRRFERHAMLVRQFVGRTLAIAQSGVLYETRQ